MAHLSPLLRFHLRIYQAIGFHTLSVEGNTKQCLHKSERYLKLWAIVIMLYFNIVTFTVLLCKSVEFLFSADGFGYFNDTLTFIFANIAVTSSYLESVLTSTHLNEFWRKHQMLQSKLFDNMTKSHWIEELWLHRSYFIIFYGAMGGDILALILFVHFKDISPHIVLFWCAYGPFFFAVHLRNTQFVFYVQLMHAELVKLQQDLQLMVDYSRFRAYGTAFKGFEQFLRCKILEKQQNFQLIFEMNESFLNSFGFSLISVLMMIYVHVLIHSYFLYYLDYRGWSKSEIIILIPTCLQFPMILIISKRCMDVVRLAERKQKMQITSKNSPLITQGNKVTYITLNLHSIISQFNSQHTSVTVQLQNFSLQILHQPISINGIGIIRMDGYMLARVIGSITTYMIFFIQFMPKFTNMNN